MKKLFINILRVLFWIYAIATFLPIYSLVSDIIKIPVIDIIISIFVTTIPIVNYIIGIIGATKLWNISTPLAILFYTLPLIIIALIVLIDTIREKQR